MEKRIRRSFSKEFKLQMVQLYLNGKPAKEITQEYDLTESSIHNWVRQYENTKSFKSKDNMTPEQIELIQKDKRIKQLEMENDILKQAALNMDESKTDQGNKNKYSVQAMCDILEISCSVYHKYKEPAASKDEYAKLVDKIFNENQKAYGKCNIKQECQRQGVTLSRRRIALIMRDQSLVSLIQSTSTRSIRLRSTMMSYRTMCTVNSIISSHSKFM